MKPSSSAGTPRIRSAHSSGAETVTPRRGRRSKSNPVSTAMRRDSSSAEDARAARAAEDGCGRRLDGRERERGVGDPSQPECELVERQRPRLPRGHREGEVLDVAARSVPRQSGDPIAVGRPAEGDRVREHGPGRSPGREDQHAVLDLHPARRTRDVAPGRDRGELTLSQLGSDGGRDLAQLEGLHTHAAERLQHRLRPVEEPRLRREQLDVDEVAGERAEGKYRLERCNARSGDEHAQATVARRFRAPRHPLRRLSAVRVEDPPARTEDDRSAGHDVGERHDDPERGHGTPPLPARLSPRRTGNIGRNPRPHPRPPRFRRDRRLVASRRLARLEEAAMRTNLAGRIGRWSAAHWKRAAFGWLALALIAALAGGAIPVKKLKDSDIANGEAARAQRILEQGRFDVPATESVLVQSQGVTVDQPAFNAAVAGVVQTLSLQPNVTNIVSPIENPNAGLVSRDRHSALVEFDIKGKADKAGDEVAPILAAVDAVQAGNPSVLIQEFGQASANHELSQRFSHDMARAEYTSLPATIAILIAAFGALVAAGLPVLLALSAILAATGLNAL